MKLNPIKNKIEEQAIVLCGHGSRDSNYLKELIKFEDKLQKKLSKTKIFRCFIEINNPSIEECLNFFFSFITF